jgi:hypothetical protein
LSVVQRLILLAVIFHLAPVGAMAQQAAEIPSTLDLAGQIVGAGAAAALVQHAGATVLVIDQSSGATVGSAPIADAQGHFVVTMSQSKSFNGTIITMQLSSGGAVYPLLEGDAPVSIPYNGSFPFPTIIRKQLSLANVESAANAAAAPEDVPVCPTRLAKCDIFGTGIVDERDIDFIKQQLGSRNPDMRADVDGNGVVNALDLLSEMRAFADIRARTTVSSAAKH